MEAVMDWQRVRREIAQAQQDFLDIEAHPTTNGGIYVLAALVTSERRLYTMAVQFPDTYPYSPPEVTIRQPEIGTTPHRYTNGRICYVHPTMWNPGRHNLTFA